MVKVRITQRNKKVKIVSTSPVTIGTTMGKSDKELLSLQDVDSTIPSNTNSILIYDESTHKFKLQAIQDFENSNGLDGGIF